MYYVYVLKERRANKLYYGYTSNLQGRINAHNKKCRKWDLVYYEAYKSEYDARNREKRLKQHAQALTALKSRLKKSLK